MGPQPPRTDSTSQPPLPISLHQLLESHNNDPHAALSTLLSRHNDLVHAHATLQAHLASASRQLDRSAQENDRLWKSLKASPRPGATRQNSDTPAGAAASVSDPRFRNFGGPGAAVRKASDGPGIDRLEVGGGNSGGLAGEDRLGSPAGMSSPGSGYRYQTPPPLASASSAAASPVLHAREQSTSSLQKSSSVDFGRMGEQELAVPAQHGGDELPRTPARDAKGDPNLLSVGAGQFRSSTSMPSMVLPPDHPTTPTDRRFLPQIAPVSPLYSDNQPRASSAASSPIASPGFPLTPNQPAHSSDSHQLHPTTADYLRRARSTSSNSEHDGATPYGSSGPSAASAISPDGALASPAIIVPSSAASAEPSPGYSSGAGEHRPVAVPSLAAHLLGFTRVKVNTSNIKVNERGKEVISFIVDVAINLPPSVDPNQPNGASVRWKVEKMYSDILLLDSAIKSKTNRQETKSIGSLPDKSLFKDHAPHKSDQRKSVLERYLQTLLSIQLRDRRSLVDFFNTDLYVPDNDPAHSNEPMSGWLTKKGRAFQGWQTRFYKHEPGVALSYYDTKGGTRLGEISLLSAAIGRQSARPADAGEDAYLHAFLIRTTSESSGDTDHILCAENDEARDAWVHALTTPALPPPPPPPEPRSAKPGAGGEKGAASLDEARRPNGLEKTGLHHVSRKGSADLAGSSSAPSGLDYLARSEGKRAPSEQSYHSDLRVPASSSSNTCKPQPSPSAPRRPSGQNERDRPVSPEKERHRERQDSAGAGLNRFLASNVSGPMNAVPLPSGYEFKKAERQKKTKSSFWNFSGKSSVANDKVAAALQAAASAAPSRPVFGVPLKEAVQISRIRPGLELPAVVYRCVEYLEAKNAEAEEGIFRLSGSANVIRMLKDRFNAEGDVNLLTSNEYYDPHAIAGLLKLFLRELPVHILTRELHAEFIQVIDLRNRKDRVNALGRLVARLPIEEYTLFRFFFAHLCLIAQNAEVTKMNLRNLGIVFSVNLSIPAPLFTLLLTEFDLVFAVEEKTGGARPIMVDENGNEIPPGQEPLDLGSRSHSREPEEEGPRGEVKGRNRNSILYEQSGANVLMERQNGGMNTLREQADRDDDDENGSVTSDAVEDHFPDPGSSPEVSFHGQNPQYTPHPSQVPHQRQPSENEVISFGGGGYSQSTDVHGYTDAHRSSQRGQTSPVQARLQSGAGLPSSPRIGGFGEVRR